MFNYLIYNYEHRQKKIIYYLKCLSHCPNSKATRYGSSLIHSFANLKLAVLFIVHIWQ